jgi:hypothetical protein
MAARLINADVAKNRENATGKWATRVAEAPRIAAHLQSICFSTRARRKIAHKMSSRPEKFRTAPWRRAIDLRGSFLLYRERVVVPEGAAALMFFGFASRPGRRFVPRASPPLSAARIEIRQK